MSNGVFLLKFYQHLLLRQNRERTLSHFWTEPIKLLNLKSGQITGASKMLIRSKKKTLVSFSFVKSFQSCCKNMELFVTCNI